jgi:hypothetical protein
VTATIYKAVIKSSLLVLLDGLCIIVKEVLRAISSLLVLLIEFYLSLKITMQNNWWTSAVNGLFLDTLSVTYYW